MAFVMRFTGQNFTTENYDEVVRRLEAAGEGSPAGRIFHVAFGDPQNLRVSDIWDTRENFERFFSVVGGIMQDLGVEGNEPEFYEVHNVIVGDTAEAATA